jgi:hypothetical protein
MTDFITLSCPSCGAKLNISEDIERFACSYCGQEHIVKRSGGIVSLSPVVAAIKDVQYGTDKTAAELAIVRIQKEISELEENKQKIEKGHDGDCSSSGCVIIFLVACLGVGGLFIFSSFAGDGGLLGSFFGSFLTGVLIIAVGFSPLLLFRGSKKTIEEESIKINKMDEQIANKKAEIARLKTIVD